jgi:hypothetical protein
MEFSYTLIIYHNVRPAVLLWPTHAFLCPVWTFFRIFLSGITSESEIIRKFADKNYLRDETSSFLYGVPASLPDGIGAAQI